VVTNHSSLSLELVDKILDILASDPVDVIETDGQAVYECQKWQLVSPRDDGSVKIGAANLILANNLVLKVIHTDKAKEAYSMTNVVFQSVLALLEAKKLIRQSPNEIRKGFKVITNDRETKERET
jgi:hypothetical protein